MQRTQAVLALLQCILLAVGAAVLWTRVPVISPLLGLAALAQGVLACLQGVGRGQRILPWVALSSLVVIAVLLGLLVETAAFVFTSFMDVGARKGWLLIGGGLIGLPWVAGIPIWQLAAHRGNRLGTPTALVVVAVLAGSWLEGHLKAGPELIHGPIDGEKAAQWLFQRQGAPPDGPGPVHLVVTQVRNGQALGATHVRGDTLAEALNAVDLPPPDGANSGLILEHAVSEGDLEQPWLQQGDVIPSPSGILGFRTDEQLTGAWSTWRGDRVARTLLGPFPTPALRLPPEATAWVQFEGWLATEEGVWPLERGWTAPQPLEADQLLDAALAAGHHLAANMSEGGRFAYVVKGPSGLHGPGYNFPRHAGGAWFLARIWQRTQDPLIRQALEASLEFLIHHSQELPDGRRFVLDPSRKDGKAWVGTNALALLAFTAANYRPDFQQALALHLVSSVDAEGRVRGDLDVSSGTWPQQPLVTYAQGQVLLGLAVAERAGLPGVRDALVRAAEFTDQDYWPTGAGLYLPLDEHWMCLATLATSEVLPHAAGERVCRAWLQDHPPPPPSSDLLPPAGPAGGTAEAWVAVAELDRRANRQTSAHQGALDYGRILLDQVYQVTDAPLVDQPERLVGGFRDRPHLLDVRVDAVQHIACALMGIEQLLREKMLPGATP